MWVNDTTLDNFGQVCPNLQFLGLSDCLRLNNLGIGEVSRGCPEIRQLNIDCLQVSDIFGGNSDISVVNLKILKARGTQINDKGMAMIENRCRNLQYLDIGYCNKVTGKGVTEVVENCARLRDINLIGCEKFVAAAGSRQLLFCGCLSSSIAVVLLGVATSNGSCIY
ncbi:hypothetical protein RHMOL_Rhmol05G0042100 [Rhododendron molle]|uniref:Uncharacterized protein n=1 Tax=Rhododendron molle TaxID=49168 RepID=A0ACC0NLA3_RHOML|nr:hypothetical protein RHMOL_Rhmol05G0042100 [Rhododendron molle]